MHPKHDMTGVSLACHPPLFPFSVFLSGIASPIQFVHENWAGHRQAPKELTTILLPGQLHCVLLRVAARR